MKFSQEQVDDTIIPKMELGKELVERTKDLNRNIESIMGNSVKSYENVVYKIGTIGDQIQINPTIRNDSYQLICWCVDNHCQYQTPPSFYNMNKDEIRGLADFILKYLEND